MSLDYNVVNANACEGSPFSNSTVGEMWMERWCYRCWIDKPWQDGNAELGCPLILSALSGYTPAEWIDMGVQDYHCSEFVPDDDGGGDEGRGPHPLVPQPECEGQLDILSAFADGIAEQATGVVHAHG